MLPEHLVQEVGTHDASQDPSASHSIPPPPPVDHVLTEEQQALREELQGLLEEGSKIHAIQRLREHAGLSLRDAKEAVDALERGDHLLFSSATSDGAEGWNDEAYDHLTPEAGESAGAVAIFIVAMIILFLIGFLLF